MGCGSSLAVKNAPVQEIIHPILKLTAKKKVDTIHDDMTDGSATSFLPDTIPSVMSNEETFLEEQMKPIQAKTRESNDFEKSPRVKFNENLSSNGYQNGFKPQQKSSIDTKPDVLQNEGMQGSSKLQSTQICPYPSAGIEAGTLNSSAEGSPSKQQPSSSSKDTHTMSKEQPKTAMMAAAAASTQMQVEEQVRMHLTQLKEQQKAAEELRLSDKKRQQVALKEKLKKRSEMKKQKSAAASGTKKAKKTEAENKLQDLTLEPVPVEQAPQPTVPVTKKETIYTAENIELFKDLETFAVNMEKVSSASTTFAMLMDSMLITQLSDLEKVRILFHWITAQDLNSINFPPNVDEDTPLGFLLAVKQDKKTYASLFVRLCGAAGLHAKMITGYLKGAGYYPDYEFGGKTDPFRGSWNAVLLNGEWRLIDTNWGARHVNEESQAAASDWHAEYKYEEHYFLADPDLMINTHFPDEQQWQLLQQPYTINDFQKATKLWPLFYKLKIEQQSHHHGIVTADENGYVKIQLKVSPFARADTKLKADLRPRQKGGPQMSSLNQYMFHYTDPHSETFEIFLPQAGQYILKVFGLSAKFSDQDVYTNICMYQINCPSLTKPPTNVAVLPPFPIISMWYGISVVDSQTVAKPISHQGPLVECDANGEAKIQMAVIASDRNIVFSHDLLAASVPHNAIPDRVVQSINETPDSTEITFLLRTPAPGNYALALYSNVADTNSNTFVPFCYYLVTSKQQSKDTPGFPAVPNGCLGQIQPKFTELSLSVAMCHPAECDWKFGSLKTDDVGECSITFAHERPLTILADFSSPNAQSSLIDYTCVDTTGSYTTVTVRTPVKMSGDTTFVLKVYAAELHQSQNIPSVFVAFVQAGKADLDVEVIPQSPTRMWGPVGLTFAKHGLTSLKFKNSVSSVQHRAADKESEMITACPRRIYNGGEDFEMVLNLSTPLQLKARLLDAQNDSSMSYDNYILFSSTDVDSNTIRLRLVQTGLFLLIVYGSSIEDTSGQLSPLIYVLIDAKSSSASTAAFPATFGVWTSSAHTLFSPLCGSIERSKEVLIKVYLAQFRKSSEATSHWTTEPYSEVMLVVDGATPVMPRSSSSGTYEWSYVPGPAEKMIGILVKPSADSTSMTYAMQFQIA